MQITLDLFGFQKKVSIDDFIYHSGVLKTVITSPIGEILNNTIPEKINTCLLSDIPYLELMFYRCNDGIWRTE